MALTHLPAELLDMIIGLSVPEGFESLAKTCKRIYAHCEPFIERHNELRHRFRNFSYQSNGDVIAASELIQAIASNPIVARYIRKADLLNDSTFVYPELNVRTRRAASLPSIEDGGPVVQLFAESVYLQRAGLHWRDYYSAFTEDVRLELYSQKGSAFLLTLLENVEEIITPSQWKPDHATKRLLDVLAREARHSHSSPSGLRSLQTFEGELSKEESEDWGISWTSPFLAFPHLQSLSCNLVRRGHSPFRLLSGSPHMGSALTAAYFEGCCIADVVMTDFLKHTPRLTTLYYAHNMSRDFDCGDWNMGKFFNAVAHEAGSRLRRLTIKVREFQVGSVKAERASTRFEKLERLEIPLELFSYNTNVYTRNATLIPGFSFQRDVIPQSITNLALLMVGKKESYDMALDALIVKFREIRRSELPNLEEMHLNCSMETDNAYKQQCEKLMVEGSKEGVAVHLRSWTSARIIVRPEDDD